MASGPSVVDAYAPLIEYVLEMSKLGKLAPVQDPKALLHEIRQRLDQVVRNCPGSLSGAVDELRRPAMALVDYLVGHGDLSFAREWERDRPAADDSGYASADETFVKSLEHALDNRRGDLLPFYYLALQLGYGGTLAEDGMKDSKKRIEAVLFDSRKGRELPFRTDNEGIFFRTFTEKRDFTVPPEESVILVVVVAVVLALAGIVFTMAKYADATAELRDILQKVAALGG